MSGPRGEECRRCYFFEFVPGHDKYERAPICHLSEFMAAEISLSRYQWCSEFRPHPDHACVPCIGAGKTYIVNNQGPGSESYHKVCGICHGTGLRPSEEDPS